MKNEGENVGGSVCIKLRRLQPVALSRRVYLFQLASENLGSRKKIIRQSISGWFSLPVLWRCMISRGNSRSC